MGDVRADHSSSVKAAAFAASEAVTSGEWDDHLVALFVATRARMRLLKPPRTTAAMRAAGQVWVWLQPPGVPGAWEIRGTGVTSKDLL
jgi:hypothetical protein